MSARTRVASTAVWDFIEFVLTSLVFILIGLQLRDYRHLQRWHDRLMELEAWRNPWPTQAARA